MTNLVAKKVAIGTIANKTQINASRLLTRHPNWILLNGGGVGKLDCLYSGEKYKGLFDFLNLTRYSGSKRWGVDILYMPPPFEAVLDTDGVCGETGTAQGYDTTDKIFASQVKATKPGFITSVYYGNALANNPLTRYLLCLTKNGNDFTVINRVKMDFPGGSTGSPSVAYFTTSLPNPIYVPVDTYVGIYPSRYISVNTNAGVRYYYAGDLQVGQVATFSSISYPPDLKCTVLSGKPSYYMAY